MPARFGLGPVFAAECVATARRWQVDAWRSLCVAFEPSLYTPGA